MLPRHSVSTAIAFGVWICTSSPAQDSRPTSPLFDVRPVPAAVHTLLPESTAAALYVAEPEKTLVAIRKLAAAIRPGIEQMISFETVATQLDLGFRPRDLDLMQPMAITFDRDGPKLCIVTARDADEVADLASTEAVASGNLVAIQLPGSGATPAVGPASQVLATLPQADLVMRIDLTALHDDIAAAWEFFQDMFTQIPNGDAALSVYEPLFESALEGGQLDLLVDFDGTNVRFSALRELGDALGIAAATGGPSMTDLMTRLAGAEDDIVFGAGDILTQLTEVFDMRAMFAAASPEQSEQVKVTTDAITELYRSLDGASAGTMSIDENGMRGGYVLSPKDPVATRAALATYGKMLTDTGVAKLQSSDKVTVDGITFETIEATYDLAALPGVAEALEAGPGGEEMMELMQSIYGNPIKVAAGQVGDYLVMTFGIDPEGLGPYVRAARDGGQVGAAARRSLSRMPRGGERLVFMHMDLASILDRFAPVFESTPGMPPLPAIPAGTTAPMWFGLTRDGGLYRADTELDVLAVAKMFM